MCAVFVRTRGVCWTWACGGPQSSGSKTLCCGAAEGERDLFTCTHENHSVWPCNVEAVINSPCTHTHTHRDKHIHWHIHTQKHTHWHARTHTHTHTHTLISLHTQTHTRAHTDRHTQMQTHTRAWPTCLLSQTINIFSRVFFMASISTSLPQTAMPGKQWASSISSLAWTLEPTPVKHE